MRTRPSMLRSQRPTAGPPTSPTTMSFVSCWSSTAAHEFATFDAPHLLLNPSRPHARSPCGALADGGDVVVTVRRSKTNQAGDHPDVRRLVGGCAAAVRRLQAADRAGTWRFRRRSQYRPGEQTVCGRLRRGRPRGPQNLVRRPRGTRRRAHRPRGRHPRRPARRRPGRTPAWWSATPLRSPRERTIGPANVKGIEINPYAAELALPVPRMSGAGL